MKALLVAVAAVSALSAAHASPPFRVAETGRSFGTLAGAIAAVGSGGTVLVAPGRYRECAVVSQGAVVIRAEAPGQAIFEGSICEGKAVLVLRGRSARIEGLTFRGLRNQDGNGAAIRLETGRLSVWNSRFEESQEGILANDNPIGEVEIEKSTFTGLGRCDGGPACAHSIYIGAIGSLTVRHSRFDSGTGGHYIKSRAAVVTLRDNLIDDRRGDTTNYLVDLSNGAVGGIVHNHLIKGANGDNNCCLIAVAAEGATNSSRGLVIRDNVAELAKDAEIKPAFVATWTPQALDIGGNRLGPGIVPFKAMP